MAVEIDQIETFVAVVRGGGFTKAASLLHLSQPAVSRRLELLERELGAPLFERIRSGAILTEAGRTFLPHAEALLASMRDGLDSVRALNQVDRGAITLALVGTLASTTLTGCLRSFRDAHPRVELRLRTALSQEVSVLVRRGDARPALRRRPASRHALGGRLRRAHDGRVLAAPSAGSAPAHRAVGARHRAVGRVPAAQRVVLRAVSVVASEPTRLVGAESGRDRPDRQPHGSKANGRGGLRPGALARKQRRRGAAHRDPPRDANRWKTRHDPGLPAPSPRRISERGRPSADRRAPRVATPARTESSRSAIAPAGLVANEARRAAAPKTDTADLTISGSPA